MVVKGGKGIGDVARLHGQPLLLRLSGYFINGEKWYRMTKEGLLMLSDNTANHVAIVMILAVFVVFQLARVNLMTHMTSQSIILFTHPEKTCCFIGGMQLACRRNVYNSRGQKVHLQV